MKKIKLFFALLAISVPGYCLTLSQIKTEIRIRIKDSGVQRLRYTDAQLLNIINQTQRDAVNLSWIIKKSTDISLVSGTTNYTLPTDTIALGRVTLRGASLPEVTLETLDSQFNGANWTLSAGLPQDYFQDPARPAQVSFYPWPNNSSSTGTVHINYFAQPTDLSSDSDIPFNSDVRYYPYHDLLIYEPCAKIFLIEGDMGKYQEYKAYYESRVQIFTVQVSNKVNFLPGFSAQRK